MKRKTFVPFSMKMEERVAEMLASYCRDTGATKTWVIERAIVEFIRGKEKK